MRNDPSMLGVSKYTRAPLDHYPTPKRAIQSLLSVVGDDLPMYQVWEPFCGNGAVSNEIKDECRDIVSTDIRAYEGFDPDGLFDFFKIVSMEEHKAAFDAFDADESDANGEAINGIATMRDIEEVKGFMPDCIISNPPYGKDAQRAIEHSLKLMEPVKGSLMFLMRHEYDASKNRRHLFRHPAFTLKIVLNHRPRWIEGSKGAPRFPYAWYVWSWSKAISAPGIRAETVYVD